MARRPSEHLLRRAGFGASEAAARYGRYSWPVEFVVRAIKEVGWAGFTMNDALILQFSEFGRRITENGSQGTDH